VNAAVERIALVEQNDYHEETLFAFATAITRLPGRVELTIFSDDNRGSHHFLSAVLGIRARWRPAADWTATAERFDLVVLNTLLRDNASVALERADVVGRQVLALVHDVEYFADREGAKAVLARFPGLTLAYPSAIPSSSLRRFSANDRVIRFLPVFEYRAEAAGELVPVAMPGTIEFSRRDYLSALDQAAATGLGLHIFGRSFDSVHGEEIRRTLDRDRARLLAEIERRGLTARQVVVSTNLDCKSYFRAAADACFVSMYPADPAYLAGKLTGSLTTALSCGVPMIAPEPVREALTRAWPLVSSCVHPGELTADEPWPIRLSGARDCYQPLRETVERVRSIVIADNTAVLEHLLRDASRRSTCGEVKSRR
jgi:hypothetical protein